MNLSKRQLKILSLIKRLGQSQTKQIQKEFDGVSRSTIIRDLNDLLEANLIEKKGQGRGVYYQEKIGEDTLKYFDLDSYFSLEADERPVTYSNFNFDVFKIKDIFSSKEIDELKKINKNYRKRINNLSKEEFKKELERLSIELSWKSSKIEGNTYSLIDTEVLIKESKEAPGHNKEEAIMILNHKKTIDFIIDKHNDFQKINLSKIRQIHSLLVDNLGVRKGIRKRPVGIVGTKYTPLDNQHQIQEAVEKMIEMINEVESPFSKAFFAITLLSYIQPFEDGNKRTARLLGNAILLAFKTCPLSYRSVDEVQYKKALVLFYEQNNLRAFKELFVEQFKFSIKNYFFGKV
jgi:Fic family protein